MFVGPLTGQDGTKMDGWIVEVSEVATCWRCLETGRTRPSELYLPAQIANITIFDFH